MDYQLQLIDSYSQPRQISTALCACVQLMPNIMDLLLRNYLRKSAQYFSEDYFENDQAKLFAILVFPCFSERDRFIS